MNTVQRSIRGGTSGREIINRLPKNAEDLSPRSIFEIFRDLKNVQYMTEEDLNHFKFQSFLNRTESLFPEMTAYQLSDIAIDIMSNTLLKQNLIKDKIKDKIQDALILKMEELPFEQIMHLGVIIRKTRSSDNFESIHLKIREIFLQNVKHFLSSNHRNNIRSISTIVDYMTRNVEIVQTDILEAFSNALLCTDIRQLRFPKIGTIILLFSKFGALENQSKNALNDMVNFWNECNPSLKDIEELLSHLLWNRRFDKQAFRESGLIRFILNVLDENIGELAFHCFEQLMRMVIKIGTDVDTYCHRIIIY